MAEEIVDCAICFEEVIKNGTRATARLGCSHSFHLDCIGSAINVRRQMQCPTCRFVEHGEWIYSAVEPSPPPPPPPPPLEQYYLQQQPPPQLQPQQNVVSEQPSDRDDQIDLMPAVQPWQSLPLLQPYIAPPSLPRSPRHDQALILDPVLRRQRDEELTTDIRNQLQCPEYDSPDQETSLHVIQHHQQFVDEDDDEEEEQQLRHRSRRRHRPFPYDRPCGCNRGASESSTSRSDLN